MISKVRMFTYSKGLNTVRLIKLIREAGAVPLNEALDAVNRFVAGEAIDVAISSERGVQQFTQEVLALGVGAECIDGEVPAH